MLAAAVEAEAPDRIHVGARGQRHGGKPAGPLQHLFGGVVLVDGH